MKTYSLLLFFTLVCAAGWAKADSYVSLDTVEAFEPLPIGGGSSSQATFYVNFIVAGTTSNTAIVLEDQLTTFRVLGSTIIADLYFDWPSGHAGTPKVTSWRRWPGEPTYLAPGSYTFTAKAHVSVPDKGYFNTEVGSVPFQVYHYGYNGPGDFNNDGIVNDADYTVWADYFYKTPPGNYLWGSAPNGGYDDGDYTSWADNYGMGTIVPEPASLSLLGLGLLGLLRRRA